MWNVCTHLCMFVFVNLYGENTDSTHQIFKFNYNKIQVDANFT